MAIITEKIDNSINNLLQSVKTLADQRDAKSFSNLINTLSANVEKTQSSFVTKAAKTNTSSINKYALKDNHNQRVDREIDKNNKTDNKSNIDNKKTDSKAEVKNTDDIDNTTVDEKQEITSKEKEEVKEAIENLFNVLEIDLSQDEELKTKIEELVSNIETIEQASEILSKVEAMVEQSSLSTEDKEALSSAVALINNFNQKDQTLETESNSKVQPPNNQDIEINSNSKIKIETPAKVQTLEEEKIADIAKVFDKLAKKSASNKEQLDSKTELKLVDKTLETSAETIQEIDIEPIDNTKKENNNQNQQERKNPNKESFIEKVKEELRVEFKSQKIPAESGALSASDEVIKMAINEKPDYTVQSAPIEALSKNSKGVDINNLLNLKTIKSETSKFDSYNILNQIGDKLSELKDGRGQKLTMILRPNDLGRLSIELTTGARGLNGYIVAQNEDVRAYIEKNISTLQKQLSDSGVNVNNIQIKTQGSSDTTNWEGANHQDSKEEPKDNNNQNQQQKNQQFNKEKQETLANLSNYDLNYTKEFANVLNKTISYELN